MTMMFDQNSNNSELTAEQALEALCGEGKKYATVGDLAKAYLNADNHISILEAETADLRKKADSITEVQALLKAMKEGTPPQQQAPVQDQNKEQPQDLDKWLEDKLNSRSSEQTKEANQKKVIGHFQETFGASAGAMFDKMAKELDMNRDQLEQMSATQPNVVLKLAGSLFGGKEAGAASLSGNAGGGAQPSHAGVPTTRSEILKKAEAEKWPRNRKYETLNREMTRAANEGRLDAWNR